MVRSFKKKIEVKTISSGLRIVHLITDHFILMILFYLINSVPYINNNISSILALLIFLSYPVFYTLMEFFFQQTPGKMITNTIVIDKYANKPSLRICLLRTLIRFIPFEHFSCLSDPSRGWHDRWSDTYVIPKKDLYKLKKLLEKHG